MVAVFFYHAKTGELLLDETKGLEVQPQYSEFNGNAGDFGELRALINE